MASLQKWQEVIRIGKKGKKNIGDRVQRKASVFVTVFCKDLPGYLYIFYALDLF